MNLYLRFYLCFLFLFGSLGSTKGYALEQSLENKKEDVQYHQTKEGDWFTRLRALYILPDDSSSSINTIPHSGVGVNPAWTGEFDLTYMFSPYLGAELILGTAKHSIWGKRSLEGTKVGTTWILPPTLTLQYRPFPKYFLQPYLGLGVNYTLFYGVDCDLDQTHLKLSNSWRPAVQGGIDFFFYRDWIFNVDIKYIWIDTVARLSGAVPGKAYIDIDPWVFGFGFGRKW